MRHARRGSGTGDDVTGEVYGDRTPRWSGRPLASGSHGGRGGRLRPSRDHTTALVRRLTTRWSRRPPAAGSHGGRGGRLRPSRDHMTAGSECQPRACLGRRGLLRGPGRAAARVADRVSASRTPSCAAARSLPSILDPEPLAVCLGAHTARLASSPAVACAAARPGRAASVIRRGSRAPGADDPRLSPRTASVRSTWGFRPCGGRRPHVEPPHWVVRGVRAVTRARRSPPLSALSASRERLAVKDRRSDREAARAQRASLTARPGMRSARTPRPRNNPERSSHPRPSPYPVAVVWSRDGRGRLPRPPCGAVRPRPPRGAAKRPRPPCDPVAWSRRLGPTSAWRGGRSWRGCCGRRWRARP